MNHEVVRVCVIMTCNIVFQHTTSQTSKEKIHKDAIAWNEAAMRRAREIFYERISDSDNEPPIDDLQRQLSEQKKVIDQLKQQLEKCKSKSVDFFMD